MVLVNGGTANASEVVTGALQDLERAAVVGERTYGKGCINTIFAWKNLDFRLKLTTAWYFTPKGRNIEGHGKAGPDGKRGKPGGLQPDREVALAEAEAQAVRRRLLDHEPLRRHRAAVQKLDAEHGETDREPFGPDRDAQLAAALEALRQRLPAAGNGK